MSKKLDMAPKNQQLLVTHNKKKTPVCHYAIIIFSHYDNQN